MIPTKKRLCSALLALSMACLLLAGCGASQDPPAAPEPAPVPEAEPAPIPEAEPAPVPEAEPEPAPAPEEPQTMVYIGTARTGFISYPADVDGEVTPEALIAAISDLTGWNLTLADAVTTGKGGMSVSFAPESALFTGPPDPQKEEFFAYDNFGLTQMILDSIQETLRQYYVLEPGDPASLDLWYSAGDQPIEIEDVVIPMDQPWDSDFFSNPQ